MKATLTTVEALRVAIESRLTTAERAWVRTLAEAIDEVNRGRLTEARDSWDVEIQNVVEDRNIARADREMWQKRSEELGKEVNALRLANMELARKLEPEKFVLIPCVRHEGESARMEQRPILKTELAAALAAVDADRPILCIKHIRDAALIGLKDAKVTMETQEPFASRYRAMKERTQPTAA
jgi:ribosomal protein L7/L12